MSLADLPKWLMSIIYLVVFVATFLLTLSYFS